MKMKMPSNVVASSCDSVNVTATNPELVASNQWFAGANKMLAVGNPNVVVKVEDPMKAKSSMSTGKKSLV